MKAPKKQEFHKSISLSQTIKARKMLEQYPKKIKGKKELIELEAMKGIGKKTIQRIEEILDTGKLTEIKSDNLTDQQIKHIENLKKVINIGSNKAKELVIKHKLNTVEELKKAHQKGIVTLNDKILLGLKYYNKVKLNIPREEVMKVDKYLHKAASAIDIQLFSVICGSYRRMRITSNDIDVLITHPDIKTKKQLEKMSYEDNYLRQMVLHMEDDGFLLDSLTDKDFTSKYMGFCRFGKKGEIRRIDIRFVPHKSYYAALLYFTGSGAFNRRMRELAISLGYKLNEYGLYKKNKKTGKLKRITVNSEEDIFKKLRMEYLQPEDREAGK